ncbi:NAD-dependent epimerase/dehydratase family protein [Saccharomonospora sp.]|uniref:NAD-dependent epimerase/dehydratase family protein n=1 Tax=Saccharomonospora sp. TaxID=33913 RepID=UPI00261E2BA9|nr:NAD-dependent epimerase/dehydratase family protein [Saccharomonospora sp.]
MAVGATVVVTGATGNVGTALLRQLSTTNDIRVTGVARRIPEPDTEPYRHARWVSCDLGEPDAVDTLTTALDGADAVVHLAWAIHPRRDEPSLWRTNVTGTRHLLQATARAGVERLIVGSSVAAYSPTSRWSMVSEDWETGGIDTSAYSRSKVWLERELDTFTQHHPDITLSRVRPCAILQQDAAGEFARWLLGDLVPGRWIGRPWLPLPLWPQLRIQLVHADDVAAAIIAVLNRQAAGSFNLAAEPVLHAHDIAGTLGGTRLPVPKSVLSASSGLAWCAGLYPLHPGWLELADKAPLADTTRARAELDWEPAHNAKETLASLVSGLREGSGTTSPALAPETAEPLWQRWRSVTWGTPSHQSQS